MDRFLRANLSTWMMVVTIIVMAANAYPRLISYIMIAIGAALMLLTREVARHEGARGKKFCPLCFGAALLIIVVAVWVIMKVNWLSF